MNVYLALSKGFGLESGRSDSPNLLNIIQSSQDTGSAKTRFYQDVIRQSKEKWASPLYQKGYKLRYDQMKEALVGSLSSNRIITLEMENVSPMVVGHGGVSVLETSLMLHRTYGVPYIPGSTLKGLTAQYCRRLLGVDNPLFQEGQPYYTALFGSTSNAGYIEFHDAWITPDSLASSLLLDVLTPHHQKYNSIRPDNKQNYADFAPRDDDDPVPIPFLAVRGQFRIMLTCPDHALPEDHAEQWLSIAQEILMHALEKEGVGGKQMLDTA